LVQVQPAGASEAIFWNGAPKAVVEKMSPATNCYTTAPMALRLKTPTKLSKMTPPQFFGDELFSRITDAKRTNAGLSHAIPNTVLTS
jgi:hypothetical protein